MLPGAGRGVNVPSANVSKRCRWHGIRLAPNRSSTIGDFAWFRDAFQTRPLRRSKGGLVTIATFSSPKTVSSFSALAAAFGVVLALAAPASAKDWKTVRIGMDATYAPFESINPKGEIIGFEVDYAKALCDRMKVTCTFQNQDWDGIIPSLLAGKFDTIISSMNITPPRQKRVLFSQMYFATPIVFIGQAASKSNDFSPAALKGKTIGTQSSTTFANYLEAYYKDSEIKLYPGGDEPNLELSNGRLDYALGDFIVGSTFIEKSGAGCCRIMGEVKRDPAIFGPGVGAAFRFEDADLQAMFNKAIDELDADGTYQKIASGYFKINIRGK
jgi:lysine-arginine-ornithine-binding protein